MKFNITVLLLIFISINFLKAEIPFYSAKYNFESEEISITGKREFVKESEGYEVKFEASNLVANLFFSSKFLIKNKNVIPNSYDIKIKPKFLNRDQSIKFDYENSEINSKGLNEWKISIDYKNNVYDPLNVQIMIRTLVLNGYNEFELNILDMEKGGFKSYSFNFLRNEECFFNDNKYNCHIYERRRNNSERIVRYFLIEEFDFMFLKILDSSPERINKLELKEILSFG